MEHNAHLFKHFSATLHESRWHEVLAFIKKLQPLLPTLRCSFRAVSYSSGEDEVVDTAQAHGFECWALEQVLQCSFFQQVLGHFAVFREGDTKNGSVG